MTRRPNPKYLTEDDRINSVSEKMRRHLIFENANGKGLGMKTLAQRYGIPDRTVRAIIHQSRRPEARPLPPSKTPCAANLWERPDLWHRYGIKGPCTPRMVPAN